MERKKKYVEMYLYSKTNKNILRRRIFRLYNKIIENKHLSSFNESSVIHFTPTNLNTVLLLIDHHQIVFMGYFSIVL